MPGPPGDVPRRDAPGDGVNVHGILGVDPALDRVAALRDVALAKAQLVPAAMRICSWTMSMPVMSLGHRMLDLHARVHLDEEELVVLVQELERARRRDSRSGGTRRPRARRCAQRARGSLTAPAPPR
jgi:hypothetical protein